MFAILQSRINQLQEDLGNTAGVDPLQDRYRSGAIRAYKDLLEIEFEETSTSD